MPNARRVAEMMQEDLGKVGVNAEIVSYEWGEYLKKSMEPNRDGAVILGWTGDNGDPDNFLSVLLSCAGAKEGGANRAFWCNEEFSGLLQQAKVTSDQAERTKLACQGPSGTHQTLSGDTSTKWWTMPKASAAMMKRLDSNEAGSMWA